MLPAAETCPFKAEGVFELPLREDAALLSGSTLTGATQVEGTVIEGEEGMPVMTICPHNPIFMSDPNIDAIIAQQSAEMQLRALEAAQALAASTDAAAMAGN